MTEQPADPLTYSYRAAAFGAPRTFRLTDDGIAFEAGRTTGLIRYDSVTKLRMAYRPGNLQSHRFITEIWSSTTRKLPILSTSSNSLFAMARQDDAYRAFIVALHRRLVASGAKVLFVGGLPGPMYWFGVVVFAGAALGLAGLTVRALHAGTWTAAAMVAAFLLFFLWQGGIFLRRNRPMRYTPDRLPDDLLPRQALTTSTEHLA